MREEKLSDAIVYDKLHLLQKDFSGYIERNSAKVDINLPVFYGYVISALENSFPNLSDEAHDEFVDNITFKVLDTSNNIADFDFVKRVMVNAIRFKKRKNAEVGINIVVGLKLLKVGDFIHALDYLKKHATLDAKLGTAVAFCYYTLSLREFKKDDESIRNHRPGEMELLARELMINLARLKPPVNKLRQLELDDPEFLEKIFWQMILTGLEWFPSEKWFLEVGLKNAAMTNDPAMRKRLLDIGSEHFYTDMTFLREMYYYKLENRDAGGAAGIVNQLIKQYPGELEPIYLGLKLSLLTTKKITYHSFRKLALSKGMPAQVIELFDFSFELLTHESREAYNRLADFEHEFPRFQYFATVLRYIAADFASPEEMRVKRARKALLDAIELFCLEELKQR
jgi:tetratricopeptide (TPR) repeat protein